MKSRTSEDLALDFHARGEVAAYPDAIALMCDFVRRLAFLSQLHPESAGIQRAITIALSLLDEMRVAAVAPNVISYSAAISACEKGGRWEQAVSLLDEMREAGVLPNVVSFNAAISACEKGGRWERAGVLRAALPDAGQSSY